MTITKSGARARIIAVVAALVSVAGCQGNTRTFALTTGDNATFELDFTEGKKVEIWLHNEGKPDVALEVKGGRKGKGTFREARGQRLVQHVTDHFGNRRSDPRNGRNSGVLSFKESPADAETK